MKNFSRYVLALSLATSCAGVAATQDMSSGSATIPKVLAISREYIKPGKSGMAHDRAESAFGDALARAKWPTHYIGMTSMSGKSRSLFLTQYASFEALEKDLTATIQNASLTAALDHAAMADGELLDSMDQGIFYYQEEMSLHPRADLSQARFMALSLFHVRPGKTKQWTDVVKMAKAGYEKGVPNAHWAIFEQVYGGEGGTYLLLTSHKTLAEIDKGFADDKQFEDALGEDGMKKFSDLFAECCETAQQQLFAFNPHQSYPPEEWIKSDPSFWKPKAVVASTPKTSAGEKKSGE